MKRIVLAALMLFSFAASAIDSESFSDPVLQERYNRITHLLRCPKCQNGTIAESPVGISEDLRKQVRRMLEEGSTDQEILDFMSARYGDFILYKPPVAPRTLLLWMAPALLLIGGLVTVVIVIRRRASQSFDETASDEVEGAADNNKADAT